MVMDLLLRDENRTCIRATDGNNSTLPTRGLIELISGCEPTPSVIIDVGAQILDLNNRETATKWLNTNREASVAVYYDEYDDPQVLDRTGYTCRLAASPIKNRLDKALIFLDHAHARGVDLSIPAGATGAVILGPRLSRDRLVQGKNTRSTACKHNKLNQANA
jgi:hypothetical protein